MTLTLSPTFLLLFSLSFSSPLLSETNCLEDLGEEGEEREGRQGFLKGLKQEGRIMLGWLICKSRN